MKKNLKFLVLALLIIGVIGLWQSSVLQTKNKAQQQQARQEQVNQKINITFVFADDKQKTIDYQLPENNTKNLFTITQEVASSQAWDLQYQDYGEMGYLVTKIDTLENGQDNKYWQYFVDDQMPQVSADKYIPKNGEEIKWTFAESTF
ncbi:MAG: DUF4430 domain-containing protein [Patescibacteria group bacterium]|jgi:hypothetical protein